MATSSLGTPTVPCTRRNCPCASRPKDEERGVRLWAQITVQDSICGDTTVALPCEPTPGSAATGRAETRTRTNVRKDRTKRIAPNLLSMLSANSEEKNAAYILATSREIPLETLGATHSHGCMCEAVLSARMWSDAGSCGPAVPLMRFPIKLSASSFARCAPSGACRLRHRMQASQPKGGASLPLPPRLHAAAFASPPEIDLEKDEPLRNMVCGTWTFLTHNYIPLSHLCQEGREGVCNIHGG